MWAELVLPAAILVTLTAVLLLMSSEWRASLALLALQYLGLYVLVVQEWPWLMAFTRLVAGWVACFVLALALNGLPAVDLAQDSAPGLRGAGTTWLRRWLGLAPGPLFYLFTTLMIGLSAYSQMARVAAWIPQIGAPQAWASLILVALSLLKLSFSSRPLHSTLGLLTLFAGFEILYVAISAAPLTAALSAAVTLGLALVGAYLMQAPAMLEGGE
jgi:hypothetical protein